MTGCCTVVIPTMPIPERRVMLGYALRSVMEQEHAVDAVSLAVDNGHEGAWVTRQRALDAVQTDWTFFLDDDDQFKPEHTRLLLECAYETDADYVFSYWDKALTADPLGTFGLPFDPRNPHHTTMTILVKTKLAQSVGFTAPDDGATVGGEDWRFLLGCVEAGAHIVHLPKMTWIWVHHLPGNTSGMPINW